MVTINVRRLDADVVARLKRRAALNNRSLEGEARHILQCAADDDMAAETCCVPGDHGKAATLDRRAQADPCGSADPRGPRPRPSRRLLMRLRGRCERGGQVAGCPRRTRTSRGNWRRAARTCMRRAMLASEIANALWRKARSGEIERRAADVLIASVPDMPVRWGVDELRRRRCYAPGIGPRSPGVRLRISRARAPDRRDRGNGGPSLRGGCCLDRARRIRPDAGRLRRGAMKGFLASCPCPGMPAPAVAAGDKCMIRHRKCSFRIL